MQARLRKLDKKLQRSRYKEKKLRAMLRGAEMAELEGSDFLGASKRSRKNNKKKHTKSKKDSSDGEEKKDEDDRKSGSDNDGDPQDSSSDSDSVSSDEGDDQLLNDPVDGDSALAVMVRKIRRRFNKKQAELGDIKKQFKDLREELIQVTGDLEEARVVARSARERALDEAKADFDAKARALAERCVRARVGGWVLACISTMVQQLQRLFVSCFSACLCCLGRDSSSALSCSCHWHPQARGEPFAIARSA